MKVRTMVVDDEYLIVKSLTRLLEQQEGLFQVVAQASDGQEALAKIRESTPDLLILDISMPIMDGLTLLQAIQNEGLSMPALVILSAYREFSYAQQAMRFGCREYLLKPFIHADFSERLRRIAHEIELNRVQPPEESHALLPELFAARILPVLAHTCEALPAFRAFVYEHRLPQERLRFCIAQCPDGWRQLAKAISQLNRALGDSTRGICFPLDGQPALYLSDAYCLQHASELAQAVIVSGGSHCVLIISERLSTPDKLASAFDFVSQQSRRMFFTHALSSPLLYAENTPHGFVPVPPFPLTSSFAEALRTRDEERALKLVLEYFTTLDSAQSADPDSIRQTVYDAIIWLRTRGEPLSPALEVRLNALEPSTLRSCLTLDALFFLFYSLILDIFSDIARFENEGDRVIALAKQYCTAHLSTVSLSDVAEQVHMSKNYFSRYFKQHIGKNFNDYLTALRMQTACEQLTKTTMRIIEISQNIGYSTASHFIGVFKNYIGMTPAEYRNQANCRQR